MNVALCLLFLITVAPDASARMILQWWFRAEADVRLHAAPGATLTGRRPAILILLSLGNA